MASHVAVAHEWPPWTSPPIKRANLWTGRDDVALATLARRYEAWRRTRAPGAAAIPRTLHQIWLGPRPPPTRLQERAATFKALHPDWTYRLWRDADARAFGLENAAAFAAARNEGARSDVLRYEVLWREGGVYADVDFDFLKPLDALCASADAFVGFSHVGAVELNNGFLGAAPGHGLMRALVDGVAAARPPPPDPGLAAVAASGFLDQSLAKLLADADAAWTIERTGPGLLTRVFCEGFLDAPPRTVCLPFPLLYPVANDGGGAATEDSLAVHRWGKSWQTG